jgi:hypothetical protein
MLHVLSDRTLADIGVCRDAIGSPVGTAGDQVRQRGGL